MRIVAGTLKGRKLDGPGRRGGFRPTEDRTREALFNILSSMASAGSFLDLFAGSGAVGLEALSRGFGPVCFVERDRRSLAVLRGNVAALTAGLPANERPTIISRPVASFVNRAGGDWSVVFCDPPYDLVDDEFLHQLLTAKQLASCSTFILEHSAKTVLASPPAPWLCLRRNRYGSCALSFYRRQDETA